MSIDTVPVDNSSSSDREAGSARHRRQYVISVLEVEDTPITIDELTDEVVAWERQRATTQPPERRQVRAELHDVDLPALDRRGLIDFNTNEGLVGKYNAEREGDLSPVEPAQTDSRWERDAETVRRYLAGAVVAVLSLTVLVAAFADAVGAAVLVGALSLAALAVAGFRLFGGRGSV